MGKFWFHYDRTDEYWYVDFLFGLVWAGGYDAITKAEVAGIPVYERVGRVYRLFDFVVWGSNQR